MKRGTSKRMFIILVLIIFVVIRSRVYYVLGKDTRIQIQKLGPELKKLYKSNSRQKILVDIKIKDKTAEEIIRKFGVVKKKSRIIPVITAEIPVYVLKNLVQYDSIVEIQKVKRLKVLRNESIPLIRADDVEILGINGSSVKVAIIDTGIDETHSELSVIASNYSCSGLSLCNDDNDYDGHGTHVAGIVAGSGGYGYGHGVARGSRLLNGKCFYRCDNETPPYNCSCDTPPCFTALTSDVRESIEWALEQNASVISLSIGGDYTCYVDDDYLAEAVDNATKQGALVIVAAGNDGAAGTIDSPGCAKRALTVGAVYDSDVIASFSSQGPTSDNRTKPDLVAPGVNIFSSWSNTTDQGWVEMSGTSQATPHVAGVAALVIQRFNQTFGYFPEPDRVKAILLTAVNVTGMNSAGYKQRNNVYGAGRIDAYEAIQILNFTVNKTISEGEEHVFRINATGDILKITLYWPEDKDTNNDLDLIVENASQNISYPTDPNDTVEQVFIYNPSPGWHYVYVKGVSISGSQLYYLASNVQILENIPPSITVKSPVNNSIYNVSSIDFNITVDKRLTNAFVSIDNGINNTMTNDTLYHYYNVSIPALGDGLHNATFYVNDTEGNQNKKIVYFAVDTTLPLITVISPQESVDYSSYSVWLNVSTNENCSVALFSMDAGQNQTMTKFNETYFFNQSILTEGYHNVTFYVKDLAGWWNKSQTINFSVMIIPIIENETTDKPLILVNETINIIANVVDENLNSTLVNITWPNNTISKVYQMKNDSSLFFFEFNLTNETGEYKVEIIANDTFGNVNKVNLTFLVTNATNFTLSITNGTSPLNLTLTIFYNGTDSVRNKTTNEIVEITLPKGFWDLKFNTTKTILKLIYVNLTENLTRSMKFDEKLNLNYINSSLKVIDGIAVKLLNFSFSFAYLNFTFNNSSINYPNNLEVYKCGNWNFTESNCTGGWISDSNDLTFNATINLTSELVEVSTFSLSAFVVGEVQPQESTSSSTTTSSTTSTTVQQAVTPSTSSTTTTSTSTTTSSTSSTTTTTVPKPTCGNGKCEAGENSDNCCLDCGCPEGFFCSNNVCIQMVSEIKKKGFNPLYLLLPILVISGILMYFFLPKIKEWLMFRELKEKWRREV